MASDESPPNGGTEDLGSAPVGKFLEESPLQILVSQRAAHTYVVLAGELDGATAPFLVRTLVSQQKKLFSKGKRMVIYAPTPMALRLFQITGLDDVLTIEPLRAADEDAPNQ
jgi:anti-anti-sigma regulatory factor